MPQLSLATMLTVSGIGLDVIGFLILTYDQLKGEKESSRLADIRNYIEALDLSVNEMDAQPIPAGVGSIAGMDLGKAQRILRAGVAKANLDNRATSLQMIKEVEESAARRRPLKLLALFLIAVGALLQGVGAALPQSSP